MKQLRWIAPDAPADAFPPVEYALSEPDGLLAAGGDLSRARLLAAYARGIFPWFERGQPVLWWSPDPRAFLFADDLYISRRFRRTLRKGDYSLCFDQDFRAVIEACAAPRRSGPGTWITPGMLEAYTDLHQAGQAHSLEIRIDGSLAGGIYGLSIGRMFYAESMFSRRRDASKIALTALVWQLAEWGFPGIDCQLQSAHLRSLGSVLLPRPRFLKLNKDYARQPEPPEWTIDDGLMAKKLAGLNIENP